jgi:pimeloyl-ACP methyl ester carboxylesterase
MGGLFDARTGACPYRKRMTSPANPQSPRRQMLDALPIRERRLELAGISTAVLEGGEGHPVVLLHGPLGHAAHWMGVIPGLARDHTVIVPDLPGHGESGVGDGVLDVARMMAWLEALIVRTCAAPPVLVGQLLGGAIGLRYAIERGLRLRRLVLIDTFGFVPLQPAPQFAEALMRFQAKPSGETHDGLWRHCAFDLDGLRERMGERWRPFAAYNLERALTPTTQAAMQALMQAFGFEPIPPDQLARIRVPTTLVWGRHDMATPLAVAEAASRSYGWPLHVIESANDDPPIEQPEAVLDVLRLALGRSMRAPTS